MVRGLLSSLLLPSVSNHAYTIMQRLSQYHPFPQSPGLSIWCSLPGSSKEVISLLFFPRGRIFWLGTGPSTLYYSVAVPGELVHRSSESGQGSAIQSRNTDPKENPEYCQVASLLVHLRAPPLWPGWTTSPTAQGASAFGISLEPPEVLQKPVLKKPSTTLGELENSGSLRWWAQRS